MSAASNGKQVYNPTSPQNPNPNLGPPQDGYKYIYIPSLNNVPCSDSSKFGRIIIKR